MNKNKARMKEQYAKNRTRNLYDTLSNTQIEVFQNNYLTNKLMIIFFNKRAICKFCTLRKLMVV
jgi:hypothetical protein